jgi:hypothetical protein
VHFLAVCRFTLYDPQNSYFKGVAMGTLNAIYVRAVNPDTVKAIKTKYRKATTEAGSEFYWIPRSEDDFRCPEKELAALAKQLNTDVLWLTFQSVSDSFAYHHWRGNKHLRSLEFQINEEGWERVEGTREPWELAAFDNAELEAGSVEPFIDARETARAAGEHYALPGWIEVPRKVKAQIAKKKAKSRS